MIIIFLIVWDDENIVDVVNDVGDADEDREDRKKVINTIILSWIDLLLPYS